MLYPLELWIIVGFPRKIHPESTLSRVLLTRIVSWSSFALVAPHPEVTAARTPWRESIRPEVSGSDPSLVSDIHTAARVILNLIIAVKLHIVISIEMRLLKTFKVRADRLIVHRTEQ